ncbi:MAG: hypothetical protein IJE25_00005, partial [Clostridia bacterium]|nr:hypothetical protein [Clostridia bacterium]
GNKIVAGNLDVELHMYDGSAYVDISNATNPIFGADGLAAAADGSSTLWEPGKTQVVYLAIKNAGSLALKYKVALNVTGIEKDLDKVLTYTITPDAQAPANMLSGWDATGAKSVKLGSQVVSAPSVSLNAGGIHYFALAVHMDELAGNEYMNASISFDLTVLATQLASEDDSFGPSYDDGAGFQEITSPSIDRPTAGGTEDITFTSASGVSAKVPAEVLDAMPAEVTEVSLNHSAPKIDGNNVVFDAIDFVDQNGNVIDLSANTVPVEVKLPLGNAIAAGTSVLIYHDGVLVDDAVVDTEGNIVYNAAHFCEVEVKPVGDEVVRVGSEVYESIQAAVDAAKDGDILYFVNDVEQEDGVKINNKNITIDFNGKTFTVTSGATTNSRNILINGTSEVSLINGTLVAAGDYYSGAYGTVRTENTAKLTLDNLVLYNYRGNGLNVKGVGDSEIAIKNTKIYSVYGGGIEAAGATITVDNVLVEQKGMYTAPYNSMAISVNGGGKVTVNSGTFSTECITAEEANNQGTSHGPWVVGVLNSGGELIINGGVFSNDNFGDNALATAARGMILADTAAKVTVNGGTFNGFAKIVDIQNNLGDAAKNPVVTVLGGKFSVDPMLGNISSCIVLPRGYAVLEEDGAYVVRDISVAEVDGVKYISLQDAIDEAADGKVVLYADIALESILTIAGNIELDLNGYVLSGVCNASQGHLIMVPYGTTLTVSDSSADESGKITFAQGSSNVGWTIDLEGTLNLESGTIELTGSWSIGYAVDVRPNAWGSEYTEATVFNMNGGKLVSSDGAVRVASSSSDTYAKVEAVFNMNGGEIFADWDGVFIQQSNAAYDTLTVNLKGGKITSKYSPIRFYGPVATSVNSGAEKPMTLVIDGTELVLDGVADETAAWYSLGVIKLGGGVTKADVDAYATVYIVVYTDNAADLKDEIENGDADEIVLGGDIDLGDLFGN